MSPSKRFAALGLAIVVVIAGCAAPAQPGTSAPQSTGAGPQPPGGPKRITAAIKGDPPTLSEAINSAGAGGTDGLTELEQLVHVGLAVVDGDGRLAPRLGEAVPTIENGLWKVLPDGRMETTWKLRPNARWHDGAPVTAEDLVFTFTVLQERQVAIGRGSAFEYIDAVEAPSPDTATISWKKPFIYADSMFSTTGHSRILPMPRHLLERAFIEDVANFTQRPYWTADFVGTGPFKVREWTLGSHVVLEANDLHVQGRPKLDRIEVRFILDSSTTVANVLAGAVDLTLGRGLSLEQAIDARDQWQRGRMESALLGWTALFPQLLTPSPSQVGNLEFRRALLHALDRQDLSNSLQAGLSPIAHSIISPNEPEYAEIEASIVRYGSDPRRASQMLEGMGLARGGDGFIRDGSGQRLTLEVRTTRDDLRERLMHPIGDYWRQIGLGPEPVVIATQAASDRQYRATFPGFELTRQPAELQRYYSNQAPLPENNFRGGNRIRYISAEFDTLLDRYFTTIPARERAQALGQIVHHMTDQLIIMGIFYTVEPSLVSNRLVNVTGRKTEDVRQPWNAHEWDIAS
jgi:peptide/nickel transport system substrate-binding protein